MHWKPHSEMDRKFAFSLGRNFKRWRILNRRQKKNLHSFLWDSHCSDEKLIVSYFNGYDASNNSFSPYRMPSNNAVILLEANCVLHFICIELYNDKARRSSILLLWMVGGYSNYWVWFSCVWYFHESMLTKTSDANIITGMRHEKMLKTMI